MSCFLRSGGSAVKMGKTAREKQPSTAVAAKGNGEAEAPDRQARLEKIKEGLRLGTYHVSSGELAGKLIDTINNRRQR